MGHLATRFLQLALLVLLACHARGYAIGGRGCFEYGSNKLDLRTLVRDATKEAKGMATSGKSNIRLPPDRDDNSKSLLFRGARSSHRQQVYDNYGTLLRRVDWTLVGDAGPLANKLTIYCGDSDFYTTNNGATWIDRANTIQFRGDGATRNGQPSICPGNDYAITALGNGFAMIFLCEILEAGRNTGSGIVPAVTERGTYKQLYDRGRLQYGTQLHPELEWVVSVSLLHELFHAVMGDTMLSVGVEIVEWPKCAPPLDRPTYLTIDQAVRNPDSLSLYGTTNPSRYVEAELIWNNHAALRVTELNSNFGWTNGVILDRDTAQRARAEGRGPQGTYG